MFRFLALIVAFAMTLFCVLNNSAFAEESSQKDNQMFVSELLKLNRVNPMSNPHFVSADNVLDRKVLDSTYYALGQVNDVLVGDQGKIEKIIADVDSLGFRQALSFDYDTLNVTANTDSYALMLDRDQLQDNLPAFLQGMAPAAGADETGPISLRSLIHSDVSVEGGEKIGHVSNLLVSDKSQEVKAIVVRLTSGRNKGTDIAIPFDQDFIALKNGLPHIEIPTEKRDLIKQYLISAR